MYFSERDEMLILIGPGIFFFTDVPAEPKSGDILNLGDDRVLKKGQYRVTRAGTRTWGTGKTEYPYYRREERVGDIPNGEQRLGIIWMNI